jgi:phosphatidylglycerophosphate synthase
MADRARAGQEEDVMPLFPLVRHVSNALSSALIRMPVTPNQITTISILLGLISAAALLLNTRMGDVACGVLLTISYVLDNCDGDVARAKKLSSKFGAFLDTFGDWLVHAVLFACLGVAAQERTGNALWLWFGIAASAGSTINYVIGLINDLRADKAPPPDYNPADEGEFKRPAANDSVGKWFVFAFRELARADFCFIVLILAALDWLAYLLPFAAIGSQVYWITFFVVRNEKYHV